MNLLETHFADRLSGIEARLAAGQPPAQAFADVDDDLFGTLGFRQFPGREALKAALPVYPPERYAADCTGNATIWEAVKEAVVFWRLVKDAYARHSPRPLREAVVADYGAGWGRVTRFCAKDAGQVYAIEPNPDFQAVFARSNIAAELVPSDYLSAEPHPTPAVDLLFSFSILTHASEELCRNIRDRWAEMVRPGGVVLFTIRPGSYLADIGEGEIRRLSPEALAQAREDYAAGRLAYWPYPESPDWGITVAPMAFVEALFGKHFHVIGPRYFLQNTTQLPIVMVRKGLEPKPPARLGWLGFMGRRGGSAAA